MEEITLSQLVEDLRAETESIFGRSINDWKYSGVEFADDGPKILYYPLNGEITICLSNKAVADSEQLLYQLSHEVCHLLHPSKEYPNLFDNRTIMFNEGLSTYYQVKVMNDYLNSKDFALANLKDNNPKYYEAYLLVNDIITKDPEAIKKLRREEARIDKLTIQDFDVLDFEIEHSVKTRLLSPFQ